MCSPSRSTGRAAVFIWEHSELSVSSLASSAVSGCFPIMPSSLPLPLLCVHACVFVFVQHRALAWFSHLLIVTLTCRWWSHHRALFNRVAELESMSLNDNSQRDPGSCRRGTYVSSLFLFCPGTTESFSKDFWGNCVWERDPCTGTSGDHYEGMLLCWNCLHPVSTLNSLLLFRKSCDWVRFLATDLTRTWYSKYKHLLLLMQYYRNNLLGLSPFTSVLCLKAWMDWSRSK